MTTARSAPGTWPRWNCRPRICGHPPGRPEACRLIFAEPLPFLAELRAERPAWNLGEVTLVTRFADCMTVLRRHRIIGVDLVSAQAGWLFHGPGGQGGWIDPRACDALEGAPGGLDLVRLVTRGFRWSWCKSGSA
ncbi:hypothetical protein ACFOM8_17430 [Paracoccus angustae]|uniref:Uncharacterized protein n=1 Tax=Paracoccus angustae TaxID=1671480 RepID=A0ABV7U8B6_9RHOB